MVRGVPVVAAPAEIDVTNADWLRAVLLEAACRGHGTFVVDIEIDGTWPWRRALASGAGTVKQATQVALEPGSH